MEEKKYRLTMDIPAKLSAIAKAALYILDDRSLYIHGNGYALSDSSEYELNYLDKYCPEKISAIANDKGMYDEFASIDEMNCWLEEAVADWLKYGWRDYKETGIPDPMRAELLKHLAFR